MSTGPTSATTMRAAVLHGREDLRMEDVPIPTAGLGELVLRVEAALTCGTDLKVYRRGYHAKMLTANGLFGHELAGTVIECGEGVANFAVGDRVVPLNSAPCDDCFFCLHGQQNLCDDLLFNNGAYAQFIRIPARIVEKNTLLLPDAMPFAHAALTEPLACVMRGLEQCGIDIDLAQSRGLTGFAGDFSPLNSGSAMNRALALAQLHEPSTTPGGPSFGGSIAKGWGPASPPPPFTSPQPPPTTELSSRPESSQSYREDAAERPAVGTNSNPPTAIVLGAGPIGILFIHAASLLGLHVIAIVKRSDQVVTATHFGAAHVLRLADYPSAPGQDEMAGIIAAARALTPGSRGADIVFEAVATPAAWQAAVLVVRKGGLVNFFGGPPAGTSVSLDTNLLHYSDLTLKASFHHTPATARAAFALLASGRFLASDLITGAADLEDTPGLFHRMLTRPSDGLISDIKTVIRFAPKMVHANRTSDASPETAQKPSLTAQFASTPKREIHIMRRCLHKC